MSHLTLGYELSIDKDQLFNLLMGQGNLQINVSDCKVTLEEIYNRKVIDADDEGVETHAFKIKGITDQPQRPLLLGSGTLKSATIDKDVFLVDLKLELHDDFD